MNALCLSLFAIVCILAFLEDYMPAWQKQVILACISIAMVCMATFKPMTTTDATTYEYYFYYNTDPVVEMATEPTYIWLSRLVLAMGGEVIVMFFIYAVLTIPTKMAVLWKTTPFIFTALMVYVGIYFPMHDMVQIRCSLATAFILWALIPLAKRQYLKALGLTIAATLFHYSSLTFLPVLLVGNIKITRTWKYVLGITPILCLALYLVHLGAISLIPGSIIEGKLDLYKEMSESGDWDEYIPYKQLTFLAEFVLLYIYLFFYDVIEKHSIYAPILIKVLVIEIGFITMFSEIPVLGGRLHDLFGPINAISFSLCLYCIKPRYVVRAGICVFALAYYVIQMLEEMYFH